MNPDSVIKSFSIGDLLRNLFSGVFFTISFYIVWSYPDLLEKFDPKSILTIALPFGLFLGVTFYSLHRSLFYPIIECFFDSLSGKRCRKRIPLMRKESIETALWRWGFPEKPQKCDLIKINENVNRWADYIHFQYTSSLCTFFGIIAGLLVQTFKCSPSISFLCIVFLLIFSLFLFIAGFISDWRLRSLLDYVKDSQA